MQVKIEFGVAGTPIAWAGFVGGAPVNVVRLILDEGALTATLVCDNGVTSTSAFTSFVPNVDTDYVVVWSPTECYVLLNDTKILSVTADIPSVPLGVQLENVGNPASSVLFDFVQWSSSMQQARIQLVRRRRGQVFNNYIDTFQGDAILHAAEDNPISLSVGDMIIANNVTYEVKELLQPLERNSLIVNRWALYRDLTAPSQIVGVR